ncbi:hypothetical protein MJO28_005472 [Puccinia striiformis f. sp. tritici]|uniref:Uncharacterized protein n=3 Tax=Puccinia striiformis TaxID=27350 RepID=A0A0L0VGD8_9BASI|nr:hypothetical protein Pst134EA_009607 [Puccinia striiformis f. sp. tritici]KAI9611912.1 hypothetical protein H4Q26_007997 [Puccinia striiformis f. sp. tritici PST-130]KNE98360.1 hypothetical protein PSTG_08436 [Puccinia striiformis f. sp. tritici PST-78]POV98917.1 hypothetical protein PSTT_14128 [Puccinia striiformis]KAH9469084.1 hypothetical protein Pst134EA_009607 [Puccinia striiformis f. sp. tritici]KAI7955072.1 hypothetical protein MJO28_005472 [Puccinia striiformis f. sp. tritici]
MSAPSNTDVAERSPRSTSPDAIKYMQQGDLVIKGFRTLKNVCHLPIHQGRRIQKPSSEGIERRKELLNQLHFYLLPLLAHQIKTLTLSLEPIHLEEQTIFEFEQILGIQSPLQQSLESIASALHTLCPSPDYFTSHRSNNEEYKRIDDQQYKEFKVFRTDRLFSLVTSNLMQITRLFETSIIMIEQMEFSTETRYRRGIDLSRESILAYSSSSCKGIESTIKWLGRSEFELFQWDWPEKICRIDEELEGLLSFINRMKTGKREPKNETKIESALVLAKSIEPIVKLCRLFFNKLSARNMDKRLFPLLSGMRTDQLNRLHHLAEAVYTDLFGCIFNLIDDYLLFIGKRLIDFVHIEQLFEPALFLISHHFVRFLPETDCYPAQSTLRAWLATWYDQLISAVQHYQRALIAYYNSLSRR